jgi:hypothetical protein
MTPEEFERLKEQEKAHLRQLRDLKQQHRDVQRKKSIFDALRSLTRPDIDETHDEQVGKVMQDAAMSEARLDLAMESAEAAARAEQDAKELEELRKAQAEALVRQMKGELGVPAPPDAPAPAGEEKTIGRAGADENRLADEPERPAKSIGRQRPS